MENVRMEVRENELVITVDLTKRLGRSMSGKNTKIATTGGNVGVPGLDHIKVGLNVYTK